MKTKNILIIIAVVVILLVVFAPTISSFFTDWMWFNSLNFGNIFTTIVTTKLLLFLLVGAVTFGIIYLNLKIASRFTKGKSLGGGARTQSGGAGLDKSINKISLWASIGIGFFTGLAGAANWLTVLKFFNSTPFGIKDPLFGKEVSFYIFDLPFINFVLGTFIWIVIVGLVGAGIIYFVKGLLSFGKKKENNYVYAPEGKPQNYQVGDVARRHLSTLLFFLFGAFSAQVFLIKIPSLVYSGGELFTGAGYTDVHASLPVLKVLGIILGIIAIAALVNIFRRANKYIGFAVAGYIAVLIIGGWIYPYALQKITVEPNEFTKEAPYISNHIEATQQAFALDKVEEKQLSGQATLSMEEINNNNKGTIQNVRLWDRKPFLDTLGQLQEIRTYYDFVSADNDRYHLNGNYRQVFVSPRELNSKNLPNPSFVNKRLIFTHGYGAAVSPVNEVSEEGLPKLFTKDIPPTSTVDRLQVERPEIYYGQLTDSYVVADTDAKEFDYPAGEKNVFSNYEGSGGVKVKNFLRKFLYTLRFGEFKLLFSDDIGSESQIMHYRKVKSRVKKLLPFVKIDSDPYLMISKEGRLKWIVDGYTVDSHYPYSRRIEKNFALSHAKGVNYMRNSVKAVVDAYSGEVKFYIANPNDPLIKTYAKIFENTFESLKEMPEDIRAHIRYPEEIFVTQTSLYSTYHMEEPRIFYNKEDQWEIPKIAEGVGDPMMRHIIMKLPGKKEEEFIFMIPFTPQKKDNMASWMVARSDGGHYGDLQVYKFPKQRLVFGPSQIINRISQDAKISRQISLWDQKGSEVNLGPLLVIPIKNSIIYVRPLYLRAQGGNIPELKRVIVAYKKQIAMRKTLKKSLEAIFKEGVARIEAEGDSKQTSSGSASEGSLGEKISPQQLERANQLFREAMKAQRTGNWSEYGSKIEELGNTLENY